MPIGLKQRAEAFRAASMGVCAPNSIREDSTAIFDSCGANLHTPRPNSARSTSEELLEIDVRAQNAANRAGVVTQRR
jgi:hypothetical protein